MATTSKSSLVDYKALGAAISRERKARKIKLKDIAAESGVDDSKLSNLTRGRGGLSTDNLLLVCDWLGEPLDRFRVSEAPRWLVERLSRTNDLDPQEAERLASSRMEASRRQLQAWDRISSMSESDDGLLLATLEERVSTS